MSINKENMDLVNKGWSQMSRLLEEEMPQKRKGGSPFPWLLLLLFLLASSAVIYAYLTYDRTELEETSEIASDVAVNQKSSTSLSLTEPSINSQSSKSSVTWESAPNSSIQAEAGGTKSYEVESVSTIRKKSYNDPTGIYKELTGEVLSENVKEPFEDKPEPQLKEAQNEIVKLQVSRASLIPLAALTLPGMPEIKIEEGRVEVVPDFFVQLNAGSNFNKNMNLILQGGMEYPLMGNWHASTSLGYRWDRIGVRDIFNQMVFREEADVIDPGSNLGNWSDVSNSSDLQIRYENIDQQIISLNQGISYHIPYANSENHFRIELRGQIACAVASTSATDLTLRSPLVVNGENSYSLITGIPPQRIREFIPEWYYGVDLAFGIDLSEHWSLETSLSVLQTIDQDTDLLQLDEKRGLSYSLGIRRVF